MISHSQRVLCSSFPGSDSLLSSHGPPLCPSSSPLRFLLFTLFFSSLLLFFLFCSQSSPSSFISLPFQPLWPRSSAICSQMTLAAQLNHVISSQTAVSVSSLLLQSPVVSRQIFFSFFLFLSSFLLDFSSRVHPPAGLRVKRGPRERE